MDGLIPLITSDWEILMRLIPFDEHKVCYLILAHTDPAHLEKLIGCIDYKARAFIHLDAKSNMSDFASIKLPKFAEFIENRVKVYWGGISMVQATLNLIKEAIDSEECFSHLVLLSGLDYPIKSPKLIHDFLVGNPERQFIRFTDLGNSPNPGLDRVSKCWFMEPIFPFLDDGLLRKFLRRLFSLNVFKKRPIEGMRLAFGSQWWAITPACASYILEFVDKNPSIWSFYRYAHAPDEHFFHTIVANSPYSKQTDGFLEGAKWPHQLSNFHIGYLNKIYDENSFDFIKQSDKLFARKFTSEKSSKLIELIDAHFNSCSTPSF